MCKLSVKSPAKLCQCKCTLSPRWPRQWIIYIGDVERYVAPYLLTLVNRNDPICTMHRYLWCHVTQADQGKLVTVAGIIVGVIALNFANVNIT